MNSYEKYTAETALLPETPSLGWSISQEAVAGGPRPDGSKAYEICYIARGGAEWWGSDALYEAGPGSTFLNKPGEWHGGKNSLLQPCERYWVRFNLPPDGDFPGLPIETIHSLCQAFRTMSSRHFLASPHMKTYFEQLLAEHRNPQAYSVSAARAALHQILICTVRDHAAKDSIELSEDIRQVIASMERYLAQDHLSENAVRLTKISNEHRRHRFVVEVGMTPVQYFTRQRIHLAKEKLSHSSNTITEIAFNLGFSSSQYFATVFKKLVGLTPSEYRKLRNL
jgi:AraC-like DNA-binding protein